MIQHDILLGRHEDGRYIRFGGGEPVALHARTGAGKGVGFVIPNCFTWKGSLVVLDIKGEAWAATAGHRAAMGQDVYLLEPASPTWQSHRWDPFSAVQRGSDKRFQHIAKHANLIFPDIETIGSGSNSNKFWESAARQAFSGVATLLAESPEEPLTMAHISGVFTRSDGHVWLADKVQRRRLADRPYSRNVVDTISDYVGDDPKLRGDIRKTVSTGLQTWSYPQIAAVTAASDFDLRDLRRRPMTIYVVVAPGDIAMLKPLLRLFFDAAIALNTEATPAQDPTLKVQCLFMLDEFARLGRIDSLAQAAQYTRGYGLRIAYVVQSRAQLRNIYGKDGTADIFDNVGAELVFGTADQELTQELEKRLGDDTVMFTTRNRPRFWASFKPSKQGESDHPHRRPLMLDQEIARMNPDEQLIIRPGMKPIKSKRARWYTDPMFTTRVRPPPSVPKLNVKVILDDGTTRIPRGVPLTT